MANHISVLEPFFHYNGETGELSRDKKPKGNWLNKCKDVRLVRGYVLKASCKNRKSEFKSTILELSEKEVSNAIGPHALRVAGEEDKNNLLTKAIQIALPAKAITALDAFIGNNDGCLVRQSSNFSRSAEDIVLYRGTLLLASLPLEKKNNSISLCCVLLEEAELACLIDAEEKEKEWKRTLEQKAKDEAAMTAPPQPLEEDADSMKPKLLLCCIPIKPKVKEKLKHPIHHHSIRKEKSMISDKTPILNKPDTEVALSNEPIIEIGTPKVPPMHREALDRTIRQIAQAASSETWDPSWRRIGSSDGLAWSMKDNGKMLMVRGTVRAPARAVFEYIWSDDASNFLFVEPRVESLKTIESDLDGSGHTKTQSRQYSLEWSESFGSDQNVDSIVLRHYHVHSDGTIFIIELGETFTGGIVIAPLQEDKFTCNVAWVEKPNEKNEINQKLSPWASNRYSALKSKLLGDRLLCLARYGLSKAPYSDFESIITRGAVVNYNGSSGASVNPSKSSGTSLMKEKMREFNEISAQNHHSAESWALIEGQVKDALQLVESVIPEKKQSYRTEFHAFSKVMEEFLASPRARRLRNQQYPFDCIMMWVVTALPTEESWVEVLAEQLSMRNVEAQSAFRRVDDNPENNNRISQIMSRNRERLPSL